MFQNAEDSVRESKKIVEVLEEYEKINEAGGETLSLSLLEFCEENDENGKPRLEISKSELQEKHDEIKKDLEEKKKKISDIMSKVKSEGIIAYVTAEDGLRFHKTDDGCWYGYQNWISPDDRKGKSCNPLKVITKHPVGALRRIGDATYDRFKYE